MLEKKEDFDSVSMSLMLKLILYFYFKIYFGYLYFRIFKLI